MDAKIITLPAGLAREMRRFLETAAADIEAAGCDPVAVQWARDLRGDLEAQLFRQARLLLSLHLPKTGGVTFRNLLASLFERGYCQTYWNITDAEGRVLPDFPPDVRCIHGHFYVEPLRARFPGAPLVTWVREPVERITSLYHYWLREPDLQNPVCAALHREGWSLMEFARRGETRNEMRRFFGCAQPADFAFIGLTERHADSMRLFRELFHLNAVPTARANANPDRKGDRYPLDDALRAEIAALNAEDAALHQACVAHFEERFSRLPPDSASGAAGTLRLADPAAAPV